VAGLEQTVDIDQALGVEELRGRCLKHTRRAYRLLPPIKRPWILDIGCGQGQQTVELARLSLGKVVGIDIDDTALSTMRQRIIQTSMGDRVKVTHASLFDNGFDDNSFDVLWEEGVFHLLDASDTLTECRRLLKPDGYLVMHETITWFESIQKRFSEFGFRHMGQHMLPKHFWWTDYGAPLEERIRAYRRIHGDGPDSPRLSEHERLVSSIKSDPDKTDCGFYLVKKRSERSQRPGIRDGYEKKMKEADEDQRKQQPIVDS